MKKLTALILAALLSTAVVSAIEPAALTTPPSTSTMTVSPNAPTSFLLKGSSFLDDSIALNGSTYVHYQPSLDQLPETKQLPNAAKALLTRLPMGQLQKPLNSSYVTAIIYDWSYPVPQDNSTDPLHNLFTGKKSADNALHEFNQLLTMAEPFGNAMIKQYVASYNQKNKSTMPENIFSFSLRNTTPAASFHKKGYTFGTRIITKADGWTLPFYMKSYVWKKGNTYYVLAALCADSEWDMLDNDMDALAEKAMK